MDELELDHINFLKKIDVVKGYCDSLKSVDVHMAKYSVGKNPTKYRVLFCWSIQKTGGFSLSGGSWEGCHTKRIYHYDLMVRGLGRPKANRVPFLSSPSYDFNLTVSHLCHNSWCLNYHHVSLESLDVSKSRNGCIGGNCCGHQPKCIISGPFSFGRGEIPPMLETL